MKKTTLALCLSALMTVASATHAKTTYQETANQQVELTAGFAQYSSEMEGFTLNNGLLVVGLGYQFSNETGKMSFTPALQVGKDVSPARLDNVLVSAGLSDTFGGPGYEYEVEEFISASVRVTLHPTDDFYTYIRPSYSRAYVEVSGPDVNMDAEGEWEFGMGVGIGYNINQSFSVDASFDRLTGDTEMTSLSLRYYF
jgi:opacity protein-like surface antigen